MLKNMDSTVIEFTLCLVFKRFLNYNFTILVQACEKNRFMPAFPFRSINLFFAFVFGGYRSLRSIEEMSLQPQESENKKFASFSLLSRACKKLLSFASLHFQIFASFSPCRKEGCYKKKYSITCKIIIKYCHLSSTFHIFASERN